MTSCLVAEVVVLVGCSGAGKSSWALRWVRADPDGVRGRGRVNRDDLRASLFGGKGVLSPAQERVITAVSVRSVRELSRAGFSVVVDDTNLRCAFIKPFRTLAAECGVSFRLVVLDTPTEVCVARDASRRRSVGEAVIRDQQQRLLELLTDEMGLAAAGDAQ